MRGGWSSANGRCSTAAPGSTYRCSAAYTPRRRCSGGTYTLWIHHHSRGDPAVRERLARAHAQFEARERQYAAVLQAHGVPVTFVHCPAGADAREALRD